MTVPSNSRRYGRVVIHDAGIAQRPILFVFGRPFDLEWTQIRAFAVTEQVVRHVSTGEEKPGQHILELHTTANKIHYVFGSPGNPDFQSICREVRTALPNKETQSYLSSAAP